MHPFAAPWKQNLTGFFFDKCIKEVILISQSKYKNCVNVINSVQSVITGLVVKTLDSQSRGGPCSKPLGGSKVDSAFHPSEVDKMSTRNFWELSGKK